MTSDMERFWSKVDMTNSCWEWIGYKNKDGYGTIKIKGKWYLAHRFLYQTMLEHITKGLQIDHLCRNRGCVNIHHLEPVTIKENLQRGNTTSSVNARKTQCSKGHDLPIYISGKHRRCVPCKKVYDSKRWRTRG